MFYFTNIVELLSEFKHFPDLDFLMQCSVVLRCLLGLQQGSFSQTSICKGDSNLGDTIDHLILMWLLAYLVIENQNYSTLV